jgi:TPR repeat protein
MQRWLCVALFLCSGAAAAAPEDDFRAGERAYRAGDVVGAMAPLRRAAAAGHAAAQALYGYILDISEFNEEAAEQYRRAAEQGNADGQYGLGALHAQGEGVKRDAAQARLWYERAAAQGHAQAINALAQAAIAGELGFGREGADGEGLAWLRKSADLGYFPALEHLAKGYRSGRFGAVDLAQAERFEQRIRDLRPAPEKKGRERKK